jgi:hypothetical protein
MTHTANEDGDERDGTQATWPDVKFDCQIVAISKVEGAKTIYSACTSSEIFGQLGFLNRRVSGSLV